MIHTLRKKTETTETRRNNIYHDIIIILYI